MSNYRGTIRLLCLAAVVSLALAASGEQKLSPETPAKGSTMSKLIPHPKIRSARSLSDMFEKVKSKIFGRKQSPAALAASASSVQSQITPTSGIQQSAQRQPWTDLNSFNQQFGPYQAMAGSNQAYQWPTGSFSGQQPQFGNGQFGSQYSGLDASASALIGQQQQQQPQSQQAGAQIGQQPNGQVNMVPQQSGGIFSSASNLIAQYLTPSASGAGSGSQTNQAQQSGSNLIGSGVSSGAVGSPVTVNNLLSPQQQQYNEFASILDSMVAQTGISQQRQPAGNQMNQYPGISVPSSGAGGPGQVTNMMGSSQVASGVQQNSDQDMSSSSNIQAFMPSAGSQPGPAIAQQASQKSSMVSLAEQLAPGAQFNKLISFPFSLTNNEDPTKEGRFKLHIPFLNQHLKRSDQQQQQVPSAPASSAQRISSQQQQQQQQQLQSQQQYLNHYYTQSQPQMQQQQQLQSQYANQQNQMIGQASQVIPTIVSPQSSASQSSVSSSASVVPQISTQSSQASPSISISSSSSSSSSSSPSSSAVQSPAASVVSVSSGGSSSGQTQQRSSWSVQDSPSKLIPMDSPMSSSSGEIHSSNHS